jgi:hypothetical protein
MDEFKADQELRTKEFLNLVKPAWDGHPKESGSMDGTMTSIPLIAPMCILGEHEYQEEATVSRTFAIHVDKEFLHDLRLLQKADPGAHAELQKKRKWLHRSGHTGILGSILLEWMMKNPAEIEALLAKALSIATEQFPNLAQDRSIKNIATVIFGLMVLRKIYREYGLKAEFKASDETLLDAVFAANPALNSNDSYGAASLTTLFRTTDTVIMNSYAAGRSVNGNIFMPSLETDDIVYFSVSRWYSAVQPFMKSSESATLVNPVAFRDLLKAATQNPHTAIEGFPTDHKLLPPGDCVQINIATVREQFAVATNQWISPPDFEGID